MELKLFKTLWGFTGSYREAIDQVLVASMQGIEGPAPNETEKHEQLKHLLAEHQLDLKPVLN